MFLQGFAGDVSANIGVGSRPGRDSGGMRKWLARKVNGPLFQDATQEEWEGWQQNLSSLVAGLVDGDPLPPISGECWNGMEALPLRDLGIDSKGDPAIKMIDLGGVVLLGVSAEAVSALLRDARSALAGSIVLPVGYIDATFGYLPSGSMLEGGGYEVEGFLPAFDLRGRFREDSYERVLGAIARLRGSSPISRRQGNL
jgi:hypothetical protein